MNADRVGSGAWSMEVHHLRKTYGDTVAVDDVPLSVAWGEVFGILGPNGAGKTTTVECAIGPRAPDTGSISVCGLDPRTDRHRVREIVGCSSRRARCPPS